MNPRKQTFFFFFFAAPYSRKTYDQQTSLCMFPHVRTLHSLLPDAFCAGRMEYSQASVVQVTQSIFQLICKALSTPPSPTVYRMHACGEGMSGFDQKATCGSVPGFHFIVTKAVGPNLHSADL